jgi:hypothetical protein
MKVDNICDTSKNESIFHYSDDSSLILDEGLKLGLGDFGT